MEIRYCIDAENRLLDLDARWDDFAQENGGAHLQKSLMAGRSLFDFITGDEVRHLHQILLKRARAGREVIGVPFRCDSPHRRRFMEMSIRPLADGMVEYRCRALRTEDREPVFIPEPPAEGAAAMLRMCSWCNQVDDGGSWVEIEDALRTLRLLESESLPAITHSICDACLERLYGKDE